MTRYYFDFKVRSAAADVNHVHCDEEGLEFASLEAAIEDAVEALAGMAREMPRFPYEVCVRVRDDDDDLVQIVVACSVQRLN